MGLRLLWEGFRRRWRARVVALVTVASGVAVLASLLHLAVQGRDRLALDLRGYGANLVARASDGGVLRESDLPAIRTIFWRNNVIAFAPRLQATVGQAGSVTPRFTLLGTWFSRTLGAGVDPEYRTGEADLQPSWAAPGAIFGRLPDDGADPPQALAGARLAQARGWRVGESVTVERGASRETLVVTGILHAGDATDDELLTTLAPVQRLLGVPGGFEELRLGVLAKPADDLSHRDVMSLSPADKERRSCSPYLGVVAEQVSQVIPGSFAEPITAAAESEDIYRSRVELVLGLVAVVAALLTCLGVHGAVRAALLERRSEMGLMDALGARRSTIAALFVAEGLVVGVLGGIIGTIAGFGLAVAISNAVFGAPLDFQPASLPLLVLAGALLSAIGGGLAVRRALRQDTLQLLRAKG